MARLEAATTARALGSLLQWFQSQQKHKKAQLLDHDDTIQVLLSLRKIPQSSRTNPHLIPLPHPLADSSICLIIDDRPISPLPPQAVEAKIKSHSLPIDKVITLQTLKTDYVPYESRRRLCGSFDLFFSDSRILPLLPRLLGKEFFKRKKHPLKIDLRRADWMAQLRRGCGSARLYMRTGTCCHMNVGRVSMGEGELLENVFAAVDGAVERLPKGWGDVRAVYLKLEESVGLPIYQALPEIGLRIEVPGETGKGEITGEKGRKAGKRKKGNLRYMDRNIDVDETVDEEEGSEGGGEVETVVETKRKRKGERGEKVDVDGDAELEGDIRSPKEEGKKKKVKKGSEGGGEVETVVEMKRKRKGEREEKVDVDGAAELEGGDIRSPKEEGKKKKVNKGRKIEEVVNSIVGVGDDSGRIADTKRKKKRASDVIGEDVVEEDDDVEKRKGKMKHVDQRSKEQKKGKKRKVKS